jgi:hypothetical protein
LKLLSRWILICICFSLAACGGGESSVGLPTSDIHLSIHANVLADDSSNLRVYVYSQSLNKQIRLDAQDKLLLELDGASTEFSEIKITGNLFYPEDLYYYEITLADNIAARTVSVVFDRQDHANATNPIYFGDSPDILTPLVNATFSRAQDDILVSWTADSANADELFIRENPCGREYDYYGQDTAITSQLLPASTNVMLPCQDTGISLAVTRVWHLTPSPALSPLSNISAIISRAVDVTYIP